MKLQAIHQLLAGFSNNDAISNEALILRTMFRKWGFRSEIYSEPSRVLPQLAKEARDITSCISEFQTNDIAILHLSIGSDVNDIFVELPCKKIILYHNITPAHYFELVNKPVASLLARGRRQLELLKNTAEISLADSKYNAGEMESLGYKNVKVFPLVIPMERRRVSPDRRIIKEFQDGLTNILFVGRCAPNKRIEDLLTCFYYFQKYVDSDSRLIYVGSFAGTERYYYLLIAQMRAMELQQRVNFMGCVPDAELNAYYSCADIFLSMSEHEGFCAPLLEAMSYNVPVMAYSSTAVPETMDGSGILFEKKQFELIAEMMAEVVRNTSFRTSILNGQKERLQRYEKQDLENILKSYLEPLFV